MREFFQKPAGKAVAVVLALLALGFGGWMAMSSIGASEGAKIAADRTFIDQATGKPFEYVLKVGDKYPIAAPSGGKTGYPAELCYWTKDGKPKSDPTAVLTNSMLGKSGPTFCPDCGRLVVPHNPIAVAGMTPPPTQAEYDKKKESKTGDE